MGWLNTNERKLKKKLHKAEKAHARYVREVDSLKETYYEIYDKESIETLFDVVKEKGHPTHVAKMDAFSVKYQGENIDEIDIKDFKKIFNNYKDEVLEKRNEKGE